MVHLWQMARSTKAEKAQHLNAARGLLQRQLLRAEAVRQLSHEFQLSERQAYRYLEKASQLDRPVEVPETTVPITLKLPPRTAELLRKHAKNSGLTIGIIVTNAECVSAHSEKAWLSRVKRAAHFKSTLPTPLIACSRAKLASRWSSGGLEIATLSRFWLAKKLLSHRFAECLITKLQTHCLDRSCICARDVAELIFSVRRSFVQHLGDLFGRRVCSRLLGVGNHSHDSVHERVIGRMPTSVKRPSEEIHSVPPGSMVLMPIPN